MWSTNISRVTKNNGLIIRKFTSSSLLLNSNSHIFKNFSLLTNYHRSFHYLTPLLKKNNPQQFIENQNVKNKQLISQGKKKNKNLQTKQNITIKKIDGKICTYYLIVNNHNPKEVYYCFENAIKEGWNDLVNNWTQIKEVEIELSEKNTDYKRVINLYTQVKSDFVEKPKKQKKEFISPISPKKFEKQHFSDYHCNPNTSISPQKVKKQKIYQPQRSWVPFKPFQKMWEEAVKRDRWKSKQLVKNDQKLQKNFKEKGNFETFIELSPKK